MAQRTKEVIDLSLDEEDEIVKIPSSSITGKKRSIDQMHSKDDSVGHYGSVDESIDANNRYQPFYLLKSNNIPDVYNKNALALEDILSGEFEAVILSNYMFDLEWIFSECPYLLVKRNYFPP
jgi:hypothetical protein